MKPLTAPDFSVDRAAWAEDALAPISPSDRKTLTDELDKSPLNEQQKSAFLTECGKQAFLANKWRQQTSAMDSRDELDQVALKARALLTAIKALSPDTGRTLRAHTRYLQRASGAPVHLTAGTVSLMEGKKLQYELLAASWDVVNDLEQACRYASSQISPSKQSKPSQSVGKGMVFHVATAYQAQAGALPPKSAEGWFVKFMSELGATTGIPVGAKLVRGVLKEMEAQGPAFDPLILSVKDTSKNAA